MRRSHSSRARSVSAPGPGAVAWIVLVVGLMVTAGVGVMAARSANAATPESFRRDAVFLEGQLVAQLQQVYAQFNRANDAFPASAPLDADRFTKFVDQNSVTSGGSLVIAAALLEQMSTNSAAPLVVRIKQLWPEITAQKNNPDFALPDEQFFAGVLRRAADTGRIAASGVLPLREIQFATVNGSPVVGIGVALERPAPAPRAWLAVLVQPQRLVRNLGPIDARRLAMSIEDVTDASKPLPLASFPERFRVERDLNRTSTIDVAGRKWRVTVSALPGYVSTVQPPLSPYVVIGVGLAITFLLFGLLWATAVAVRRRGHSMALSHAATHDALTGLPNRSLVIDRVSRALLRAKRSGAEVGVLFVDIDGFKALNDVYGHEVGDRALIEISERLQSATRGTDTVGRIGGDEFVVVAEQAQSRADVEEVAARIIEVLSIPIVLAEVRAQVGASVGITMANGSETAEAVIRAADSAMYEAKQSGRSRFHIYDDTLRSRDDQRVRLEQDLEVALERNQLELHFQPIFDAVTLDCTGLEALIRWRHPKLGLLLPDEFLPLARRRGFLVGIDRWVFAEICRYTKEWSWLHRDRRVWCNISPAWFARDDFLDELLEIANRSAADAHRIALEFDEDVLDGDLRRTARILSNARSYGYHVVIDDFGAGASSIATLRDLELDALKLDRSLVAPIGTSDDADTIAGAMCALGHGLGLRVIAEGVERADQLAALRRFRCESVQGFLLSAAVPADQVADWTTDAGHGGRSGPLGAPNGTDAHVR